MSNLMGDAATQHMMKQNIMKEEFGWEIPVEAIPVPSAGLLYNPDSNLYNLKTLKIKAMTAHEEDILSSPALLKEGTAVDHVIRSCLIDRSIDINDLLVGDKNALMVSIRITGYGSKYNISPKCENCGETNKIEFDLSGLGINRLKIEPVEKGKNQFLYELPVTKKKVIFKFMTVNEQKQREAQSDFYEKNITQGVKKTVTSFLEHSIVSVEGITDKNKISHFVRNMPAFDSKSLRNFIIDHEPGLDMTHDWHCKHCSHANNSNLAITAEFFWPRI